MEKKIPFIYPLNFKSLTALFILFTGILFSSCRKDEVHEPLIIPSRVGFSSKIYVVERNNTEPLQIDLALPRALEKAGVMVISIDSASTADSTQYTTNPAAVAGKITINLEKGATTASFTVTSANNFLDDKTIVLNIISATGGLSLGNPELSTTITMTGNRVPPAISSSVASLPDFGNVDKGKESASQSYTLTGSNLTGNITVTASDNFKISLDDVTFSNTLDLNFNEVEAAPKTIYVRFTPATGIDQNITGTITNVTAGTGNAEVTVSGTETVPVEIPLLTENFSYGAAAGDLLAVGGSNWASFSGTENPVQYVPAGLSFPGYLGSDIDGAVTTSNGSGSREDDTRPFVPQTSGTVYVAQLVNISRSTTGDFFFCLRDDKSNGYFNRLAAKDDSGNLSFGIAKGSVYEYTGPFKYNTTYLIVIKYDFAAQSSSLYVIEGTVPATEPELATAVSVGGNAPATLNNVVIRQGAGILDATVDGIRIGTTWKGALGL